MICVYDTSTADNQVKICVSKHTPTHLCTVELPIAAFFRTSSSMRSLNLSSLSEGSGSFLHGCIPCQGYQYPSHSWTIFHTLYFDFPLSAGVSIVMSQHCNSKQGRVLLFKNTTKANTREQTFPPWKYLIHHSDKHADKKGVKCHRHPLADYV